MDAPFEKSWKSAEKLPLIRPGEIHLWLAQIDETSSPFEKMLPLLNEEEQQRAQRYLNRRARLVFTAARAVLRYLLARYLNCLPQEVTFGVSKHGKPRLAGSLAESGIEFNLAHSAYACLFGFSLHIPLGVDLEIICPIQNFERLAKRFFHPSETQYLLAQHDSDQLKTFYRIWTLKEAILKAEGSGLSIPLANVQVINPLGTILPEVAVLSKEGRNSTWRLEEINISNKMQAAVAYQSASISFLPYRFDMGLW